MNLGKIFTKIRSIVFYMKLLTDSTDRQTNKQTDKQTPGWNIPYLAEISVAEIV